MAQHTLDSFKDKIGEMLLGVSFSDADGDFRSKVFAEVQNYSREFQEAEYTSDFFLRLCELIVDCQSLNVPDDAFKIIVAGLLCEFKNSGSCPEENVRELIGMDAARFEAAKENFKDRQCITSALNREKTGKKSGIMAGKKSFAKTEQMGASF